MKRYEGIQSTVKEAPKDYISARELHKELGIWAITARGWRNQGKIRAEKVGPTWFYSRQDLSNLLEQIYPVKIDGRRAKLRDVKPWVRDSTLKEALGDYISAKDIHDWVGIEYTTLRNWRNGGMVRAKKIGTIWYYSRRDLRALIRTIR